MKSKYYTEHMVKSLIRIIEGIVSDYENILQTTDIRKAYLIRIGVGSCKICEFIGKYKLSCKAICPFYVINKELCVDQKSYLNLAELCDIETSRAVQIKILKARIEYHKKLLIELKKIEIIL